MLVIDLYWIIFTVFETFKRSAQIIKLEGLLKLKLVHVALLQIHCYMRVFELHATELQIIKNRKTWNLRRARSFDLPQYIVDSLHNSCHLCSLNSYLNLLISFVLNSWERLPSVYSLFFFFRYRVLRVEYIN